MSDHLSLEDCKWLAEIGLPRTMVEGDFGYGKELRRGDWCYFKGFHGKEFRLMLISEDVSFCVGDKYYRIPTLEDLMELAKTFSPHEFIKVSVHSDTHGECYAEMNIQTGNNPMRIHTGYGGCPTPTEAIIKLLRKVKA